ncbi:hypothetical protein BJF78_00430 [Pseudonocardia sp. CNS-139]|nr:hypothetical protein BJF78_00430 [Pseudonocardia sp. CNS-139]
MTDHLDDLRSAAEAMFAGREPHDAVPDPELDTLLWKSLDETGFSLLGVPEEAGGSGGTLADAAAVLEIAAAHLARVPLGETAVLAGWMLAGSGLAVPDGPLAAAAGDLALRRDGESWVAHGWLPDVPWARHCGHAVLLVPATEPRLVLLPLRGTPGVAVHPDTNVAGEPRDTVELTGLTLPAAAVRPAGPGIDQDAWEIRGALLRTVQLAGAAQHVLSATVRHTREREQFGRSLSRFQVVQHQLAVLAGEVSAMQVAARAAVLAYETARATAAVAVGAAKATASASAHTVAAIGHQLHGALGFSEEHRLGAATTRLWAWREEFGNEDVWHERLGAAVATAGPGGLWRLATGRAAEVGP